MKKIFSTCVILLLLLSVVLSQNLTINGHVTEDKNKAIFYATVALYSAQDSSIVTAESTSEDGSFEIKNIESGEYYLEASFLGYTVKRISNISLPEMSSNYFELTLEQDATILSTIEIKDRLPLLERKADKLIVNVENNITNTSGSLLDVMKKVPGMLVINDRLTMAGSGTPTILINGKSTQYMDVQSLLRDMPGDNIQKIEIIHQPGAEYEAAGSGPIINIILKKNSLFGTNGNITLGTSRGQLWDYTTALNLSHYAGKFNISGGLGYSKNAYLETLVIKRNLTNISPEIDGLYDQKNIDSATPTTYRGNVRLEYDLTERHTFGLASKYYNNTNKYDATNVTNVFPSSEEVQNYQLNTINNIDRGWQYINVNPYYTFEIDTSGQKIEFDVNMASYQVESTNTLTTTNSAVSNFLSSQRYMQPGDTKIFASTIDYTKPLNKIFELKFGGKYSFADLDNDLQSNFLDTELGWVNNENQSNHYLFDETIYAAYTKLNWVHGEWSGTAGLRYENSKSVGNSLTLDTILSRTTSKLFPSFSLSRKLGKVITSSIAYSYRIDRPRYSSLNPFVYYLDPFTFEQGNPNIRPELTHSAKFTLSYEGQPFFNIEYKKSTDAIVEVTSQEQDSKEASKTDINFDNQRNFSTSLFFPLDFIRKVGGYGGIIVTNNDYSSFYNDGNFEESKWNYTAFIQATFSLPLDISAELGGWFTSGSQEGIFKSEYLYGTSLGLSKKILDDKAKISIGIEDFFNRFWYANVDYQQDLNLVSTWQAPVVNAKFSYKFGNQHLKSKDKRNGSGSEEIKRATSGSK